MKLHIFFLSLAKFRLLAEVFLYYRWLTLFCCIRMSWCNGIPEDGLDEL